MAESLQAEVSDDADHGYGGVLPAYSIVRPVIYGKLSILSFCLHPIGMKVSIRVVFDQPIDNDRQIIDFITFQTIA